MNFLSDINNALSNTTLFIFFFFVIGACVSSFYNVIVFRYPKMLDSENASDISNWLEEKEISIPEKLKDFITSINLSFPSSHCYSCKNPLKWYHNIPIFSYLFLKGKCGFCKTSFSIQYPIVEFIGGIIFSLSYYLFYPKFGLSVFILASFFFMISYLLLLIDMKTMFLPDTVNYILMWTGIIFALNSIYIYENMSLTSSIIGVIVGYIIMWTFSTVGKKVKGIDVMGDGDLKLVAAIGAFLGVKGALFTIFFSPFIGIITWLYFKLKSSETKQFPFGPALIVASWIYVFYGKNILLYFNIY